MPHRSKRILFARSADAENHNAQAKNVQNILARWESSEYRPSVFAFGEPHAGVFRNPNVDILRIRPDRFWRMNVFLKYMQNFDAVVFPGIHAWADWLALRARASVSRNLPVIISVEGLMGVSDDNAEEERIASLVGHDIYCQKVSRKDYNRSEWINHTASHIIAISPFLARIAHFKYNKEVTTLPLGVDPTFLSGDTLKSNMRPRVIGIGHVREHKRPEIFVKLAGRFKQADFVWFGEGDLRIKLSETARREGLSNLSFPGLTDPHSLGLELKKSDIFILPSLAEGVPKATQEAAAAGLAQIIFGFYEAPTVVDSKNGFVVWSDEELFLRFEALLANPHTVRDMGQAGRVMAREWSWGIVAPRWEQKIIEIIEDSHRRREA